MISLPESGAASKAGVYQVPEYMLDAMVPEQDTVMSWYLLDPIQHKLRHLCKITTKSAETKFTDHLPVDSLCGFISAFLKAAKKSSIGEASYECGAVRKIGTLYSL